MALITRAPPTTILLCLRPFLHCDERTPQHRAILEQACFWPVRRPSFAIIHITWHFDKHTSLKSRKQICVWNLDPHPASSVCSISWWENWFLQTHTSKRRPPHTSRKAGMSFTIHYHYLTILFKSRHFYGNIYHRISTCTIVKASQCLRAMGGSLLFPL